MIQLKKFSSALGTGQCYYDSGLKSVGSIYFDSAPLGVFGVHRPKPRELYREVPEQITCSGYVPEFEVVFEDGEAVVAPALPIYEDPDLGGDLGTGVFVHWTETVPPNADEFEEVGWEEAITDVERLPGYREEYFVARDQFRVLRHRETGRIVKRPR